MDATSGFSTRAIHAGYRPTERGDDLTPPIHLTSTYAYPNAEAGAARFSGEAKGNLYSRLGNPTTRVLEERLASLEEAEASVVTASGMGAITSLLWTILRPGDVLLTDKTLYGCTYSFFHHGLAAFGVEIRHADLTDPETAATSMKGVAGVYFETPTNPNMRVVDIAAISELAHSAGAWVAVDNTYMTPFLQRPLTLGADYVVHSATKYLSGHGDLLAGAILGTQEAMDRVRYFGLKDLTGSCLSAFDAHLLMRGIKTLSLRMERHCSNAMEIAKRLASHSAVSNVLFPGLPNDPGHEILRRQADGFGAMIALELHGGQPAAWRFLDSLELVTQAVSLGDCESLAEHPATTTHSTYTREERLAHGISDGLVRLSVGIECLEDIWADIDHALQVAEPGQVCKLAG